MTQTGHRAREIVSVVERTYLHAWQQMDALRRDREREGAMWPSWCYVPLRCAYAVVSGGGQGRVPLPRVPHVGIVGALAGWRLTQGVYRYDPTQAVALRESVLPGDLPIEVLYRLPEWCVYIETPGACLMDRALHGFWSHLDWNRSGAKTLRLVLDVASRPEAALDAACGLMTLSMRLGPGSLATAMQREGASGMMRAVSMGRRVRDQPPMGMARVATTLWPLLSRVLYLCAENADIDGAGCRPGLPPARRTTQGPRICAASAVTTWEVGVRRGAALRGRSQDRTPDGRDARGRAGPRAPIRRAHWDHFWRWSRAGDGRTLALRWLPPTAVNLKDATDLPATIRRVDDTSA